jgi:outer membrane protein assembly factor BamB
MEIMKRRFNVVAPATALVLLVAGTLSATASDWPQWRGPKRDGISTETGLLKKWPDGGPPLAWKATGLGGGHSTVAISKGRIFTAGDRGDSGFVTALNEADGKAVWSAKLGKPGAPGWGGFAGPRATPTIDGERLYTVDQWGEMVCLSTADGKEIWRKDYIKDFGSSRPEWGFSESPLVDDDQVIVTPGGEKGAMAALKKDTGAVIWRSTDFTDGAHYSSVNIATIGGVKQYVQLTSENVVGIAPKDGKVLWKAKRKGATAVIPDPIVRDSMVYVTSGYGAGCNLFNVTSSGGKFSTTQVYANKVMVNHVGGVVLVKDAVYGFSDGKGWTCQDLKTGEAKWQEKSQIGKGSIVYADGCLYLRHEEKKGTIALIEASDAGWKELGRFDQPERTDKNSWAPPVIANGKLYIRDQDLLLCFDVKAK